MFDSTPIVPVTSAFEKMHIQDPVIPQTNMIILCQERAYSFKDGSLTPLVGKGGYQILDTDLQNSLAAPVQLQNMDGEDFQILSLSGNHEKIRFLFQIRPDTIDVIKDGLSKLQTPQVESAINIEDPTYPEIACGLYT